MIEKQEIITAISSFNFWGAEQDTGINRQSYVSAISKLSNVKGKAVAIIGVRRSGKTTILKQFIKELIRHGVKKEQTLYVNFEEPKFIQFLQVELLEGVYNAYKAFIGKGKDHAYIALDEIQNVPNWEKWIRIMQEKKEDVTLLITGSSSKLLSSELATALTGRTLKQHVFPLSFSEFVQFKGLSLNKEADLLVHKERLAILLAEYIQYGGFPEVVLEKESAKLLILKNYFEDIVNKDIISRFGIKDAMLTKTIAEMAISNFSLLTSANKLRNILVGIFRKKISPNTVVKSLGCLEEAQLIFQNQLMSRKVKEQKLYPKKLYCIDTGLINAVSARFSESHGALYENIVAVELKRRGKEAYYWKDKTGKEVDFAIKEGLKINCIINVCYNPGRDDTKKREISGLLAAMDEFGLREGTIITSEYEGSESLSGKKIVFTPLSKWLLTPLK